MMQKLVSRLYEALNNHPEKDLPDNDPAFNLAEVLDFVLDIVLKQMIAGTLDLSHVLYLRKMIRQYTDYVESEC